MADEIQFSTGLTVSNGSLTASQSSSTTADQTTPGSVQREQTISTGGSTITLTGVSTPRAIHIVNEDEDNYVDIGPDSTGLVPAIRLKPGEPCMFPLYPGVVLKAIAHTADVLISMLIVNA